MCQPRIVVEMDYFIIFLALCPCYTLAQIHVTVFVCEDDSHVLDCSEGIINISTALYGRTQSNVCEESDTTDCRLDVTDELENSCNGLMQCTVTASNDIAVDPCSGVRKYLEITYSCGDGLAYTPEITSPNFGSYYPESVYIMWRVKAPFGYRVRLHFTDFQTEGCCDFVRIYHGATKSFDDVTPSARFSGNTIPSNVTSISSFVWVRFTSNRLYQYQGFRALAHIVDIPDAINLKEVPGQTTEITSPNYAGNYPNNVDIFWRVVAETGHRVRLHFTDFATQGCCDSLSIYHGATQYFDNVTLRARFSGDTVPLNVTSISSFVWIRFTSNRNNPHRGFRVLAYAVTPNYTEAEWDTRYTAKFTVPYEFTSSEGTLSFAHYQPNDGYLSVTVCSQQRIDYSTTDRFVVYEYVPYSCEGINDVEITFTAFGTNDDTLIRVLDIQLHEPSAPSTASIAPATTSTQSAITTQPAITTQTVSSMQPVSSTQPSTSRQPATTTQSASSKQSLTSSIIQPSPDEHTNRVSDPHSSTIATTSTSSQLPSRGALSSAVIPAVSSVIVLLVIGLIIVAVFVYLRRRSREPKPVGPVDQDDDDPSLYNNPVYVSKEDNFSTPDLLVGIKLRNGSSVSPAPNGSPDLDNQYEDFDGDQKNTVKGCPLPTNNSSSRAGRLNSSPEASQVDTVNTPMYHTLIDGPNSEAIYEEGDHTYEQAQRPIQPSRNPDEASKREKGTDDVYENSSLARPAGGVQGEMQDGGENRSSDGIAVLDDDEEYNALTFNQSSDITRALKKPKRVGDHANNGYGVLDLPQDKAASLSTNSAGLHNDDVYNSLDEPTVEQHNGKQSTTGERPNGKGDTALQPGAESDYHNYQDPTQMDREGSGPRSPDLDVFSDDQYNIPDSGKQVGDYHVYQSTDDKDGDYTELDTSKMNGEDEYSTIDLDQGNQPQATGVDSFEPIYSEEVYSEFN